MSIASEWKRPALLPVDIIYQIVDQVALDFDTENLNMYVRKERRLQREYYSKELLNLRIVSRTFCGIVSPRLFRTLKFTHTLSSITGFSAIMQSRWIRQHVQAVRYEYWNPGECKCEALRSDSNLIHTARRTTTIRYSRAECHFGP